MSAATPAPSNNSSDSPSPVNPTSQETSPQNVTSTDQMILTYLRDRGHRGAERALRHALNLPFDEGESSKGEKVEPPQTTVSDVELRKHLVPFWQKKDRPTGENALADANLTMQSLLTSGVTTPSVASLLASIGPGGADEILSLDPTDKHEGFRDLEAWVDGSLDMYRVCPAFLTAVFRHLTQPITARIQAYFVSHLLSLLP